MQENGVVTIKRSIFIVLLSFILISHRIDLCIYHDWLAWQETEAVLTEW